jgi:hypothetical protein
MLNDTIGGVPVALAYCTLCGSGILYETLLKGRVGLPGRGTPFIFGSSGLLYRSNKLMFDWETLSLWNQFTGEPVTGPLAKSHIRLKTRPLAIATWSDWRRANPATTVLSLDTGHARDYGPGVVYKDYFASPNLMFPAVARPHAGLADKDYVFGIRAVGMAKAWPLAAFAQRRVINDNGKLRAPGGDWTVTEAALVGPKGEKLARLAGHVAYWFAWQNYFGLKAELYTEP